MGGCDDVYWLVDRRVIDSGHYSIVGVAVHGVHNVYDSIIMRGKVEAMETK
jgi:hypothetical protein